MLNKSERLKCYKFYFNSNFSKAKCYWKIRKILLKCYLYVVKKTKHLWSDFTLLTDFCNLKNFSKIVVFIFFLKLSYCIKVNLPVSFSCKKSKFYEFINSKWINIFLRRKFMCDIRLHWWLHFQFRLYKINKYKNPHKFCHKFITCYWTTQMVHFDPFTTNFKVEWWKSNSKLYKCCSWIYTVYQNCS